MKRDKQIITAEDVGVIDPSELGKEVHGSVTISLNFKEDRSLQEAAEVLRKLNEDRLRDAIKAAKACGFTNKEIEQYLTAKHEEENRGY